MKRYGLTILTILAALLFGSFVTAPVQGNEPTPELHMLAPAPPAFFQQELTDRENAPLLVALVFGRSVGCTNADPRLINLVAREALAQHMPPKILAATIAVESQCTPMAVSSRGALGLTQVMPKIWNAKFNFAETYNLLNEKDNVHVGAVIMAGLIRDHGLLNGVQRYNGLGVGCDTCDGGYGARVIALAGK